MPSPFQAAGAAADPSRSAPLHTNRFFTGLWTQRSPLRDAATPYLQEKYYSASRFDSLIGGQNTEITTRLTLARRPGLSVYNSASLPPFNRLYPFRTFINGVESIRVVGDFQADIPHPWGAVRDVTGPSTNQVLFTKTNTATNNATVAVSSAITSLSIRRGQHGLVGPYFYYLTVLPTYPFQAPGGSSVKFLGLTGYPALNGQSLVVIGANPTGQATFGVDPNLYFYYGSSLFSESSETGTVSGIEPAVGTIIGATTVGASVFQAVGNELFFVDGVSATKMVLSRYTWQATRVYSNGLFIVDTNNNLQEAAATAAGTTGGNSGTTQPTWATTLGATTVDSQLTWTNRGSNVMPMGITGPAAAPTYAASAFSAASYGLTAWAASTAETTSVAIHDSNQNAQLCTTSGTTGGTVPTWATAVGGTTIDGSVVWTNAGPVGQLGTAPQTYAYAYKNSITGHVSTASPGSAPITVPALTEVVVSGNGSSDPQVDRIVIYRTLMGGSTYLYLTDIANPGNSLWGYADLSSDLSPNYIPNQPTPNPYIQAQIASSNNPPPAGLSTLDYHLGRLWGFAGNVLYYSAGPDTLSGSGNESWPPLNSFTLPSSGVRTWATSIGLLVFTQSDVYIVLGQGTLASPLYLTKFQEGVGLLNYDSFTVNGSTAYLITTASRLVSFDPGAGETEVGFPIGDLIAASYLQSGAGLMYHEGSSADTALYAFDGTVGWYRMSTISAPESGQVWSPQAQPAGGCNAVASIEVAPGQKRLLVGSNTTGPILKRDSTVWADNGTVYPANTIIGSIVLAQPGQIAGIEFISTDSIATGTRPTIGLLLGELTGAMDQLLRGRQDPPLLAPSTTLWGDRYYMAQNGRPAWCRHMQVQVSWPAEAAANELLSYTIFGELKNEKAEG